MSLPNAWVEALFARLAVRYGRSWLSHWEGVEMSAVKADWADQLAHYRSDSASIRYALDNLDPVKPPSVLQFRELCRRAPVVAIPQLLPPNLPPQRAEEVREKLQEAFESILGHACASDRQWARDLRMRAAAGFVLTRAQREMLDSVDTDPG
jgi:hypothetical protein